MKGQFGGGCLGAAYMIARLIWQILQVDLPLGSLSFGRQVIPLNATLMYHYSVKIFH